VNHTKRIARMFERRFGLPDGAVMLDFKSPTYTTARHCTWYVVRLVLGYSLPEIGACFGRDHTSVMVAIRRMARRLEKQPDLRRTVDRVIRKMRKRIEGELDCEGQRVTAAIASAADVTTRYSPGQCLAQRSENACSFSVSNLCEGGREPSLISINVTL
jgi:DnaA-like protein